MRKVVILGSGRTAGGKYDGSLKAEHGTGRNMVPYVEMEWGAEAYAIVKRIKDIFDPKHLLNPGVVINQNPNVHIENLKPLPQTDPIVDKCIECGFCEPCCPSKDLTLTPRQRIVIQGEISRLHQQAKTREGSKDCEISSLISAARSSVLNARLPALLMLRGPIGKI